MQRVPSRYRLRRVRAQNVQRAAAHGCRAVEVGVEKSGGVTVGFKSVGGGISLSIAVDGHRWIVVTNCLRQKTGVHEEILQMHVADFLT